MQGTQIQQIEFILLLLLIFVVGLGTAAQKIKTPYPIVMVIGGLVLSAIPGVPHVSLSPDLVFLAILPPLLFSAAFNTSWRDFRYNLVSILLLAFGLVAFTVVGVSIVANLLTPGFDWRLGLVLGAIIAPTDAVAAISIAQRLGLPERITQILEGESLVNDASGLLALEFAIGLIVSGHTPTVAEGVGRFFYLLLAGIAVGLVLAKLVYLFEKKIDYAPIEITLSVVTPCIAYLAAESVRASGILAAVASGLYLGRHSSIYLSSTVRIEAKATWNTLTYVLNGLVFVLIGLQLPYVLASIHGASHRELFVSAAQLSCAIILLRILWVFPTAYAAYFLRTHLFKQRYQKPSPQAVFIIAWTGMRGVVSLAAAIALPEFLADGSPFPQRNMILFFTFCVILVTLVVQGLSLPLLIRWLGLAKKPHTDPEEEMARRKMIQAALAELDSLRSHGGEFQAVYEDVARFYQRRLAMLEKHDSTSDLAFDHQSRYREISSKLRNTERATIIDLRNRNKISDAVLRRIEHELDLLDARFR